MRDARGLPIAAYLGMLVALALAAAFVATLAIVIFLPPRPPDVMRADVVAAFFESGYAQTAAEGERPQGDHGMSWGIQGEPPKKTESEQMRRTQVQLARNLDLDIDQVRVAAAHVERNEMFVFQVREGDIEAMTREVERAARDSARHAQHAAREAVRNYQRAQRAHERAERVLERSAESEDDLAQDLARQAEEQARAEAEAAEHVKEEAEERAAEAEERVREAIEHAIEVRESVQSAQSDIAVAVEGLEGQRFELRVPTSPSAPEPAPPVPPVVNVPNVADVAEPPTPPEPPEPPTAPPVFAPAPAGVVLISGFEIGGQLPDGRWLVMRQGRNWAEIGWIARAALVIGGTLLVLSILAVLFARYLTRPIRSFADAVQAVGVNPQSEPVAEEGPRELRGAARAVNTMQARLRALIADRTKTLAAVAHDMRTPLMRLRLVAENTPPEQRERMAKEIGEVEALVASFIAFARDDPAEEARVRLDLSALLQSIADDHAEHGRSVTFQGEERFVITGQSLGLKRLFANLIENALKYGSTARIELRHDDALAVVDIADDGPGIPADLRETVFEPFVRLNEEGTRGAGLGLAAARSIARAHGGDIVILGAEKGALLRVTLPY